MNQVFKLLELHNAKSVFLKRRSKIYSQMAFSLGHDAHPPTEIKAMYQMARRRRSAVAAVYRSWHEQITGKAAGRVALAMQGTVPTTEYSLLASAEETHKLSEGFHFLSDAVTKIDEMRKAITGAFKKVWLPAAMLIGLFVGCDSFFYPTLEETLPRKSWPFLTRFIADIAHQIGGIVGILAVIVPLIIACWYISLSRWTGKGRALAEKTVLYSKYRDFQCALFMVNLAFLMVAEHPPREALLRMYEHSNAYIRFHIHKILDKLDKNASNAGEALVSTGLFNEEIGDLLSNYARWGDWHKKIREIADTSLNVVTEDIKKFGPTLEHGLQLLIGFAVMIVFASGAIAIVQVMSLSGMTK
ncbi:hypothetical protein GCM10027277_57990 [Pseudoduganella ginsengisoli]|uniref:Uncharacterized protein n=1 Tax=Pseudoduganella ginsengisoli TaxID=1462440 RepID=A0A6L6Q7T8_9BURK|nr:hypothetical protein [Pseudoduganella ginsengisoli]MTW05893.1 hypothetical protein [Pseudoduganella ginsengisoli]